MSQSWTDICFTVFGKARPLTCHHSWIKTWYMLKHFSEGHCIVWCSVCSLRVFKASSKPWESCEQRRHKSLTWVTGADSLKDCDCDSRQNNRAANVEQTNIQEFNFQVNGLSLAVVLTTSLVSLTWEVQKQLSTAYFTFDGNKHKAGSVICAHWMAWACDRSVCMLLSRVSSVKLTFFFVCMFFNMRYHIFIEPQVRLTMHYWNMRQIVQTYFAFIFTFLLLTGYDARVKMNL